MGNWRTPTPKDLDGKFYIDCEVRNRKDDRWKKCRLVRISDQASCINRFVTSSVKLDIYPSETFTHEQRMDIERRLKKKLQFWRYCRIEEPTIEPTNSSEIPNSSKPKTNPVECQACGLDTSGATWCSAQKPGCPMPDRPKDGSPRWFDLVQDNQTYANEKGGKQSFVSARFDCIPPVVLRLLAQCLGFGARKYGKDNWKNIEQWDHLNHAMNHINEWNRGDRSEPHLVNAIARLTFALWQAVESKDQPDMYIHPDEVKLT